MQPIVLVLLVVLAVLAAWPVSRAVALVPPHTAFVVERFGRYRTTLTPGFSWLVPFADRVRARVDLREQRITLDRVAATAQDGTPMLLSAVVLYRIAEPRVALYGAADWLRSLEQAAVESLRSLGDALGPEQLSTAVEAPPDPPQDRPDTAPDQPDHPSETGVAPGAVSFAGPAGALLAGSVAEAAASWGIDISGARFTAAEPAG